VNVFVFALQFFSYVAVTVSVIDFSKTFNQCNFPPNVSSAVRATQLLSMTYSILVQDNIVSALYTFRNGYNQEAMKQSFPDCGDERHIKIKWYVALMVILLMGLFSEALTFILIMQSTDVLGVLLNYAAVSFISTIDVRMFYLGKRGWLGTDVERHVRLLGLADNPDPAPQWYKRLFHSIAIMFIFCGLLAAWIFVVSQQTSGAYLPKTIRVEFSDFVHPPVGIFSGFYDILLEPTPVFSTSRAVYYERRSQRAFLRYCDQQQVWTLVYDVGRDASNACDWAAKSSKTDTFDVTKTTESLWYGVSENGRTVRMEKQIIRPWDCDADGSLCGEHGTCLDNQCLCDQGYWGYECNFPEPCSSLQIDKRLGPFHADGRKWSSQYEILRFENRTAKVYDHPVYVTALSRPLDSSSSTRTGGFDIVFYTGRRWALASSESFYTEAAKVNEDFETYLSNYHSYFSNYTVTFLSEPIDDIKEHLAPDGLSWFLAEPHTGQGIPSASSQQAEAALLCTECNIFTNPCYYDGVCSSNAHCECSKGSVGGLCEVPPIGNGRCDPFFNTDTFDLDGGDCCQATCESSEDTLCGRDSTGFLDLGFFFCKSTEPLASAPVRGKPFSQAGNIVALADNDSVMGAVIANGKLGLYDKIGSQWIERIVLNTCSVQAMAMASGSFVVNPIFNPPVVFVISCSSGALQTYFCTNDDCSMSSLELPEEEDQVGSSITISHDGGVIAASIKPSELRDERVIIFRAEEGDEGTIIWALTEEEIIPEDIIVPVYNGSNTDEPKGEEPIKFYEAEDALLVDALIRSRFCPCSGQGYAVLPALGSSVEWQINIVEEGLYKVAARYATEGLDHPSSLLVNGQQVAAFNFTATQTWANWTVESTLIELDEGNHTLMISAGQNAGPNIDLLSIRNVPRTESPSAALSVVSNQVVLGMSISASGNALALVVGNEDYHLDVRVYVYRSNGTIWEQQGNPIRESICSAEHSPTETIRLSEIGNTFLFSGGNTAKVFDWSFVLQEWHQRGNDLIKESTLFDSAGQLDAVPITKDAKEVDKEADLKAQPGICRAESISLSPDGNVVALNFGNLRAGLNSVVTLAWVEASKINKIAKPSYWSRREEIPLQGSHKGPLSLARNGRELAIGIPFLSADLSGGIQTFEYPRRPCDPGFNDFRVTFTIKPELTRFVIKILTFKGVVFEVSRGPYFFPNFPNASLASATHHDLGTVVEDLCIPDTLCGNLTVYPTNFGGFNVIHRGIITVEVDSSNRPQTFIFGNDTNACNFTDV